MLFEATSLASTVRIWLEALGKYYGIDARPVFEKHGIDLGLLVNPGARYPDAALEAAAEELVERSGDQCLGLTVGQCVRPTSIHALGVAWLASDSLHDAFERLIRFDAVVSTSDHLTMAESVESISLRIGSRRPGYQQPPVSIDAYFAGILRLCRLSADRNLCPLKVRLMHGDFGRAGDYVRVFESPVEFRCDVDEMVFDRNKICNPLPAGNVELAGTADRMAEDYMLTLDPKRVCSQVRRLLLDTLPSGNATQRTIAGKMARSASTLQRHLRDDGTTFQELRDEVRREMAFRYLRSGELSLGEISFLLGFSDQSNFSRTFRRWTGLSPRKWRNSQS